MKLTWCTGQPSILKNTNLQIKLSIIDLFEKYLNNTNEDDLNIKDYIINKCPDLIFDIDSASSFLSTININEKRKGEIIIALNKTKEFAENNRIHSAKKELDKFNVYKSFDAVGLPRTKFYEYYNYVDKIKLFDSAANSFINNDVEVKIYNAIDDLEKLGESKLDIVDYLEKYSKNRNYLITYSCKRDITIIDKKAISNGYINLIKKINASTNSILDVLITCLEPANIIGSTTIRKNDTAVENKIIYWKFYSLVNFNSDTNNPILIIEPTISFIKKWYRYANLQARKTVFVLSKKVIIDILNSTDLVKYCNIICLDNLNDYLANNQNHPTNTLIFANHLEGHQIRNDIISSILTAATLSNQKLTIFDSDHNFYHELGTLYNSLINVNVTSAYVFPSEILNETKPARKMLMNFSYGYNVKVKDCYVYGFALQNDKCALSSRICTNIISQDDIYQNKINFRSTLRNKVIEEAKKTDEARNTSKIFPFSDELNLFYRSYEKGNRIELFICLKDRNNKKIESSQIHTTVDDNDKLIETLNNYPFSQKKNIREIIINNYAKHYENVDVSFKTFLYLYCYKLEEIAPSYKIVIRHLMFSDIASYNLTSITANQIEEYLNNASIGNSITYRSSLEICKKIFDIAIEMKCLLNNPIKELLAKYNPSSERSLIKNALTKKFLDKEEIQKVKQECKEEMESNNPLALATLIRLFTCLSPYEINALTWNDLKTIRISGSEFDCLKISRVVSSNQKDIEIASNVEQFRYIPIPHTLSDILLNERKRQLVLYNLNIREQLANKRIIQSNDSITNNIEEIISPKSLYEFDRKFLKEMHVDPDMLYIPDNNGDVVSKDLNYYQGDIFIESFRHHFLFTETITNDEFNYLLGRVQTNTFAKNYCDYSNALSLYILHKKLKKEWHKLI